MGFCFRSRFLERHAEILSIPVIFLNIVMATIRHVPLTRMSWMAWLVKIMLHTAMRADARRMTSSANSSSHQVHWRKIDTFSVPVRHITFEFVLHSSCGYSNKKYIDPKSTRRHWKPGKLFSSFVISILSQILFLPWADPATKAADVCFANANTAGNLFGNCGVTSAGDYIKCNLA